MASIRIGYRRLYDSMGCSLANQQTLHVDSSAKYDDAPLSICRARSDQVVVTREDFETWTKLAPL